MSKRFWRSVVIEMVIALLAVAAWMIYAHADMALGGVPVYVMPIACAVLLAAIVPIFWNHSRHLAEAAIAIVILLGSATGAMLFAIHRPMPKPKEVVKAGVNVEVYVAQRGDVQMKVAGYGTVGPRTEVQVVPQVSGKIVKIHPQLVKGGFIAAHETIIAIDSADYQLAVQRAKSGVEQAQVRLTLEEAEAAVARSEWARVHPGEKAPPLVAHEPQVGEAKAALESAKTQLSEAQLNLDRTALSLPFDARVREKMVDLGQFVTVGQPIASLYGTDEAEIVVPLENRKLRWFDVPRTSAAANRSVDGLGAPCSAEVTVDFAGRAYTWQGVVARIEGQVDPRSRMVPVVIRVPDAFKVSGERPAMLPGMFADVVIEGHTLPNVSVIPRYALHPDDELWVARGDVLHVVKAEVLRRDEKWAYIGQGIESGDMIVTSQLDVAEEGMAIRVEEPGGNATESALAKTEHSSGSSLISGETIQVVTDP